MTLQECADYLGFTAAGLYQMRYNGTAPLRVQGRREGPLSTE
ncbi:MAG: hypothetical protein WKF83_11850 [Nocardioidaceae bacterium]